VIERILVATDDSRAGLEALQRAVELAGQFVATLRVINVHADSDVTTALLASGAARMAERRSNAVQSLFRHASQLAARAGVEIQTLELRGEPAHQILEQARSWPADVVVIGRGEERGVGGPWVGRQTRMVLEFADQPVLVVPPRRQDRPREA
jgi:nucleotide-binding universal stress UspA family protein